MNRLLACAAAGCVVFALLACGKRESTNADSAAAPGAPGPSSAASTATSSAAAEMKPAAYSYPAPVKGRFEETDIGKFDLVDGVAYPTSAGKGTVVYVVAKPIASPVLFESACPMTLARSLTALRNAGWVEVVLDDSGRSPYFASGTPFGGSSRDTGARSWKSSLELKPSGNVAGEVRHQSRGGFEFDLPLSSLRIKEVTEAERSQGKQGDDSSPALTQEEVTKAYVAVREAALKKDLKAFLTAQGFDETQIAAIRGLAGIEADLAQLADRFLEPGTPGEFGGGPGFGGITAEGANSKGAKFLNYYTFAPCGDRVVLTGVGENARK